MIGRHVIWQIVHKCLKNHVQGRSEGFCFLGTLTSNRWMGQSFPFQCTCFSSGREDVLWWAFKFNSALATAETWHLKGHVLKVNVYQITQCHPIRLILIFTTLWSSDSYTPSDRVWQFPIIPSETCLVMICAAQCSHFTPVRCF